METKRNLLIETRDSLKIDKFLLNYMDEQELIKFREELVIDIDIINLVLHNKKKLDLNNYVVEARIDVTKGTCFYVMIKLFNDIAKSYEVFCEPLSFYNN
jgi:hypothetical protein